MGKDTRSRMRRAQKKGQVEQFWRLEVGACCKGRQETQRNNAQKEGTLQAGNGKPLKHPAQESHGANEKEAQTRRSNWEASFRTSSYGTCELCRGWGQVGLQKVQVVASRGQSLQVLSQPRNFTLVCFLYWDYE